MAVKHNVYNPVTGKPELKTFKSEREYREFRQRPEQVDFDLRTDLKVYGESANKRLQQLERKGLTNSPAYKQAIHQIHLITGDTGATRFPLSVKTKTDTQKALQAAYKFGHEYATATPGGYAKIQKRARKGFNAVFGKKASKLSQSQYDIITTMADVLRDMYGALVPGSNQMFSGLIDSVANQFDDDDIREFALDLQNEIDNAPDIVQEYTRHLLSRGIDDFAHGIRPNAKALVDEVINREQQRLDIMQQKLKGKNNFPYK